MDDALAALKLQIEWGADEALDESPVDRARLPATAPHPVQESPAPPPRAAAQVARIPAPAMRAEQIAAGAASLDALRTALADFDGCALRDTAANLVFGEGAGEGRLMLVGEVPGPDEDRSGRPFVGPAGALLDRMLASIGLGRGDVQIAMLVPWRPPGGRPPSETEIALCLPFLIRHIALAGPQRLVLLGPQVARTLLPSAGSRRRKRGTWIDLALPGLPAPIPVLATASPAALLASPVGRRSAWADLRALRRALDDDLSKS
ncbi:MAG: uracil-DNA glycosylase [Alphaproteobacteria bacterium]|nr:uracil-DNA glycosylase [Alphaproteobacteria bacterium]